MAITLSGSLKSFHLPELLTFLNRNRKTGTLNLTQEAGEVYIYSDSGSVVFATSNREDRRLSALLLRKKKIDSSQAQKIETIMLQQSERFGRVAIREGVLTEHELRNFLKLQVTEILFDCFVWDDGNFSFVDVLQIPDYAVTISIDLANLIMEGARRIEDLRYFQEVFPKKTTVLRLVGAPELRQKLGLSLAEWKMLFLINGRRSLDQIWQEANEQTLNVYRFLYGLYANQMADIVPEEEAEEPITPDATTQPVIDDTHLLVSPESNLSYRDVLRVTLARLTIKNEETPDQIFPLIEQEYLIGRQMGNPIHISDPSISNVHARIFKGPEGYVLEDLNSRNGTFLNGNRIDRKLLRENDSIRIGNTELLYHIVYEVKRVPD